MAKALILLLFLSPLILSANPKQYLSCICMDSNLLCVEEKLWLHIDKEKSKFSVIDERSIKLSESHRGGKEYDLVETGEEYNSLNRTTLIYQPGLISYQCRIISRERLISETKEFLSKFLKGRKL